MCLICWSKEGVWSKMTPRLRTWEKCGAVDGEGEVMGGFNETFGTNHDNYRCVTIKFEEVGL